MAVVISARNSRIDNYNCIFARSHLFGDQGMGSEALDKLRGRSRSGLPSPESEDISRRRDSRKTQRAQVPLSGLVSLAKTYADDADKEEANARLATAGDSKTDVENGQHGPVRTSASVNVMNASKAVVKDHAASSKEALDKGAGQQSVIELTGSVGRFC